MKHPNEVLFENIQTLPLISSCVHIAGNEKMIQKSFELQKKLNGIFDITCDCEDGARVGEEELHAQMVADLIDSNQNHFFRAGVRIHDITHAHWQKDVQIIISKVKNKLAYITLPKITSYQDAKIQIEYIQQIAKQNNINKIAIHILIETLGAMKEIDTIATLPWVEVLDFGLLDYISSYNGAISANNMKSPGQFNHKVIRDSKIKIVQAAAQNNLIAAHNITSDLKDIYQTYLDAKKAKEEYGFLRMWSIYPTQIEAIVDAMKPNFEEIIKGQKILLEAQKKDWAPINFENELHDRASYRYYWQLLQRAKLSGIVLLDETNQQFWNK